MWVPTALVNFCFSVCNMFIGPPALLFYPAFVLFDHLFSQHKLLCTIFLKTYLEDGDSLPCFII